MTRVCNRTLATAIVFLTGSLVIPLKAQSTAAEQRQFLRISEIRIKPDSMREWVDIQKAEAIPMEKKAGRPWRHVWGSGNEFFDRIIIEPIGSLAELDGPNTAVRSSGLRNLRRFTPGFNGSLPAFVRVSLRPGRILAMVRCLPRLGSPS